jgi:hypothetical protein
MGGLASDFILCRKTLLFSGSVLNCTLYTTRRKKAEDHRADMSVTQVSQYRVHWQTLILETGLNVRSECC